MLESLDSLVAHPQYERFYQSMLAWMPITVLPRQVDLSLIRSLETSSGGTTAMPFSDLFQDDLSRIQSLIVASSTVVHKRVARLNVGITNE